MAVNNNKFLLHYFLNFFILSNLLVILKYQGMNVAAQLSIPVRHLNVCCFRCGIFDVSFLVNS